MCQWQNVCIGLLIHRLMMVEEFRMVLDVGLGATLALRLVLEK
jgi:hypothetical protein